MSTKKKFTPAFGTQADMKRNKRIHRVFDYAAEMNPTASEEFDRIRQAVDERRPRALTHDEADFVIEICQEGGINLKQQLKDLLYGYKPTQTPKPS